MRVLSCLLIVLILLATSPALAQEPTPIPVVVTVVFVYPTSTPTETPTITPTPSETPTPSATPTSTPALYQQIDLDQDGASAGVVTYSVSAGEFMIALLLFALVTMQLVSYGLKLRGK